MSDEQDILERLNEGIIAKAASEGRITDLDLAERIAIERREAASLIERLRREVEELRGSLADLASWFVAPSEYGPWIIRAGEDGADDAVEQARQSLAKEARHD